MYMLTAFPIPSRAVKTSLVRLMLLYSCSSGSATPLPLTAPSMDAASEDTTAVAAGLTAEVENEVFL